MKNKLFSILFIFVLGAGVMYIIWHQTVPQNGNGTEKHNLIRVAYPLASQLIHSPLVISGEARGSWFFEASFPVELLDANGVVIAFGPAQAQDDWMTDEFVPFQMTLEFQKPETSTGTLILKKDNPSGLPEHDDQLIVPVRFE